MRPTLRSKACSGSLSGTANLNVISCGFGVDLRFIIRKKDPEAGYPMEAQSVRRGCRAGVSHVRQEVRR